MQDENEIFFLRADERVNKYVDRPKPLSLTDARNHINKLNNGINNNESIFWGITILNGPAIIGTICLWNISKKSYTAEVGFDLSPRFQGKGIMKEAFSEVAMYAFEILKVRKLIAWVHCDNSKSMSLLGKFNFIRDPDEEEKARKLDGETDGLNNMLIYTLEASSYFKNNITKN